MSFLEFIKKNVLYRSKVISKTSRHSSPYLGTLGATTSCEHLYSNEGWILNPKNLYGIKDCGF